MDNAGVVKILREIGLYLQMGGENTFRARAYEKAAEVIGELGDDLTEVYRRGKEAALQEIPGIGAGIAEVIGELLTRGRSRYYEELKKKVPVDLFELNQVGGLGPKKIKRLYEELGVKNLRQLEAATKHKKIRSLEGFGETTEQNIAKGIEFLRRAGGRFVLGFVMPLIRDIERQLQNAPAVERVVVAGSARRRKETIGDVDILVVSAKPASVMDFFVHMPRVAEVLTQGDTKSSVRLDNGLQVDVRIVPRASYGAALNYFTGSKDHNIALRERAQQRGFKLNEYGLFRGMKRIAGATEEEIYEQLGLAYIDPELREMRGEIEASTENKLPKLIGYGDLKGDLQVQTNWTDGAHSIEEMARAAMAVGLEYIVVTDHTKRLAMTGGLDEKKLLRQMQEIDTINKRFKIQDSRFRILKGTECDILKDGSLDLPDRILAQLDVVGVAAHSHFTLSRAEQTNRIMRAMRNPHVDIVFHPTGRVLNRRPAYEISMDDIIATAKETGAVLEADAYPDRLDLKDDHIRQCVASGVKISIDSDAHSTDHFSVLEYGIAQARRGWATKADVINAWPLEKMLSFLT